MLSLFRRPQHLPRLDDLVELVLTVFAGGILVRMVLENEALVLFFQLPISHTRVNLKNVIIVLLTFKLELTEPHINLPLVLEHTERQNEDNKENGNALAAC